MLINVSGQPLEQGNELLITKYPLNFLPQSPGQYFLRPMMKEYKFEPSSQMIEVQEGTTVNLKISGTRVAFR